MSYAIQADPGLAWREIILITALFVRALYELIGKLIDEAASVKAGLQTQRTKTTRFHNRPRWGSSDAISEVIKSIHRRRQSPMELRHQAASVPTNAPGVILSGQVRSGRTPATTSSRT
jgi:hypothetical protein